MKKRSLFFWALIVIGQLCYAQSEYADVIIDGYYSGVNPAYDDFYGWDGTTGGCTMVLINTSACLGNTPDFIALPTGSYLTIGFTDNYLIDAPNQADLFISEIGAGNEFADVFISSDFGITFTYFGEINGATTSKIDFNEIGYTDIVNAVKIVGKDNGGCVPGFDLVKLYAIGNSNCSSNPSINTVLDLCLNTEDLPLDSFSNSTGEGYWIGQNITDNIFNSDSIPGTYSAFYIIENNDETCPNDTSLISLIVESCDCAGMPSGNAIIDDCGKCFEPTHPDFNQTCADCNGRPFGLATVDNCGECLEPTDPIFNLTCTDDIYIPNVFSPNGDGINDRFQIFKHSAIIASVNQYRIYDRWGELVYQSNGFGFEETSNWWDGKFNGMIVQSGLYVYHIEIVFKSGKKNKYLGDVTISR